MSATPKRDETTPKKPPASLRATIALMRKALPRDEQGATAIEYAMVAAGIGVAIVAAVAKLGTTTAGLYTSVASIFN
jgi:pilus assembly protein Flp/PilA